MPLAFQLISDVHGRFRDVSWDPHAALVVAAGDIGEDLDAAVAFLASAPVPVLYVPGNHEYYGGDLDARRADLRRLCDATGGRVHLLDQSTVVVDGTRFVGTTLWTDYHGYDPMLVDAGQRLLNDYTCIGVAQRAQDPAWQDPIAALYRSHMAARARLLEQGGPRAAFFQRQAEQSQRLAQRQASHRQKYLLDGTASSDASTWLDALRAGPFSHRFSPAASYLLHHEQLRWLEQTLATPFDGPTVVVTHHAPSDLALSLAGYAVSPMGINLEPDLLRRTRPAKIAGYTSPLDGFANRYRIDAWCHGHFHEPLRYLMGKVPVYCHPTGVGRPVQPSAWGWRVPPTLVIALVDWDRGVHRRQFLRSAEKVVNGLSAACVRLGQADAPRLNGHTADAVWQEIRLWLTTMAVLPLTPTWTSSPLALQPPSLLAQPNDPAWDRPLETEDQHALAMEWLARLRPVAERLTDWRQRVERGLAEGWRRRRAHNQAPRR